MIELTNLAGKSFFVNLLLVRLIEKSPDTVLVFCDGQKLVVKESAEQVAQLFLEWHKGSEQKLKLREGTPWKSQQL